jgi:hypothetical protein
VPLAIMRGDSSNTFLWECAKAIETAGKPAILYFLRDYYVKGHQIIKSAFDRIRRYAPEADIKYEILAITREHIGQYNLPTRPEKSDASRDAVEPDALPPAILRQLINGAIEQHIPNRQLSVLRAAEANEARHHEEYRRWAVPPTNKQRASFMPKAKALVVRDRSSSGNSHPRLEASVV